MEWAIFISLLVSIMGPGHPVLAKVSAENLPYMKYAVERSVDESINTKKFLTLIDCESGWNKKAIGDNGKANGLAQFWRGTFDTYKKIYGLVGEYKNPLSQINLASSMISDGGIGHWKNCGIKSGFIRK